jgi:hypothetical protein
MRMMVRIGACLLLPLAAAGPALAQNQRSVQRVAWNDYNWSEDAAAPAVPPVQAEGAPAAKEEKAAQPAAAQQACSECSGECKSRWCHCGEMGDPWTLPQPCFFQKHNIKISGWMDAGVLANNHGNESNGPLGLENTSNFQMNQLWLYAERATSTEDKCWDIGGRADFVFGADGPDTQAFGDQSWDYGWGGVDYGSAMPQVYVEVARGDWKVKAGRFYTPIGNEVVPATGNFFYSHAYCFYYAEPFTHTGMLATRQCGEKFSFFGGWVDGWDSGFANNNDEGMFLGGVNWKMSDKANIIWALTAGDFGSGNVLPNGAVGSTGSLYMNSIVFTYQLSEKWKYIFQSDLASNDTGVDTNQWYGINQYLLYQINKCWGAGGRLEWFADPDGVRGLGAAGDFYEATLGLNYKPHANVTIRPEIRWDWYDGPAVAGGLPYNGGESSSQFAGGFDVLVTY